MLVAASETWNLMSGPSLANDVDMDGFGKNTYPANAVVKGTISALYAKRDMNNVVNPTRHHADDYTLLYPEDAFYVGERALVIPPQNYSERPYFYGLPRIFYSFVHWRIFPVVSFPKQPPL